jgi:hypothetical protein
MPQAGRSRVRSSMRSLHFPIQIILPAALWASGRLSLLTEMSIRNLPGGKGRPVRKADKITWESRRLTALWAFTTCYKDSFIFFIQTNFVLERANQCGPNNLSN